MVVNHFSNLIIPKLQENWWGFWHRYFLKVNIRIFVSKFPSILMYFRNYKIGKIDKCNKFWTLLITINNYLSHSHGWFSSLSWRSKLFTRNLFVSQEPNNEFNLDGSLNATILSGNIKKELVTTSTL